jgi:hypothetical protein
MDGSVERRKQWVTLPMKATMVRIGDGDLGDPRAMETSDT